MSSREDILERIRQINMTTLPLPAVSDGYSERADADTFQRVLESIGGRCLRVKNWDAVMPQVAALFPDVQSIVSGLSPQRGDFTVAANPQAQPHTFDKSGVVVLEAKMAVAENGAVWLTEAEMKIRVLPFIGEHLVVVVHSNDVVATLHDAYQRIGLEDYGFGVFIAGPSKTADIEQSLVLGAHGPRTMTVLLVEES